MIVLLYIGTKVIDPIVACNCFYRVNVHVAGTSMTSVPQELSEADMAAFKASYFELGSIPEVPPPPQLCY